MVFRYEGEQLPPNPRIAVVANDALGNFVVCTPLAQVLARKFPGATINYFGGTRTKELQEASALFKETHSVFGTHPREVAQLSLSQEPYDLVVNVEGSATGRMFAASLCGPQTKVVGPCLRPDSREDLAPGDTPQGRLLSDKAWIDEELTQRHPILKTGFIGEIFCRLAYWEGEVPLYELPTAPVDRGIPDVLIAMSASLPEKLWPSEKWQAALQDFKNNGLTVGLLGAPPKRQAALYKGNSAEDDVVEAGLAQDLRGLFTLPQVVQALSQTRFVLTLDNGILHLAAGRTSVIGLFRHGIHRLWAPPFPRLAVLTPGEGRQVEEIEVSTVLDAASHAV